MAYLENDGRFPDDSPVLVWFPPKGATVADRDACAWFPGTVLSQCGPDEWHIVVDGADDLMTPSEDTGELLYPTCFRDSSELRRVTCAEWDRLASRLGQS